MEGARLGGPALAGNITLTRRVLADQNDCETRPHTARDQRTRFFGDVDKRLVGDRRAVKHEGG